jgi:hypothetical protein
MLYTCAEHLYDIYMTYLVKYSTRVHPVMKIRKYIYKKNFLASHSSFMYLSFLLYISLFSVLYFQSTIEKLSSLSSSIRLKCSV